MKKLSWLICLHLSITSTASLTATEPLRFVESIPLEGVEGRIDHMAADPDGQQLFIAALGNNSLEVVDLAAHKVVHSMAGLHEPQGVAYLKGLGLIAVANGDNGDCQFFNADSYKAATAIHFASDTDNVRYDPASQQVYVGFGSGALGVIDAKTLKHVTDIKLVAHPESFQLETQGNRIFVNVPKANQIAVIDRKQGVIVATWAVREAQANFPMALDEQDHRLFVGCRNPPLVLVYDTESGKVSAQLTCVGDADDLFYDNRTKRLYVTGGEGLITVHQFDGDRFSLLAKVPTAAGARTAFFIPSLSRLYAAVPHRSSQAAELRVFEVVP